MIYQVRASLFFKESDEAKDFFNDCRNALPKTSVINPGADNQELSAAALILCGHDELPNKPCIVQDYIENNPTSVTP